MIIDCQQNTLFIKNIPTDRAPSLVIQLDIFGFKFSGTLKRWELPVYESHDVTFNVMEYLTDQGLEYAIGESLICILEDIEVRQKNFIELKEIARNYKDGNLNEVSNEFSQYLTTLPRKLKDHQEKAAHHLYLLKNSANFSVPGSGKTSVILSVYSKNKIDNNVNCLFIVGPTACFYSWINEYYETLGIMPKSIILSGLDAETRKSYYYLTAERRPELYITSFQTLCNDIHHISKMFKMVNNNIFFIVDEAHYVKKLGGPWASAVLQTSKYAKRRCVLTGTPLPHSYADLYNLFDILWPNQFPVDHKTRLQIDHLSKNSNVERINDIIEEKIGSLFYRVRKIDLGLGPQIFNEPIIISMKEKEKYLYDSIMNRLRLFSRNDYKYERDVLEKLARGRLMRLRQAVSYPKLLSTALDNYDENLFDTHSEIAKVIYNYDELEKPAKLEKLIELVNEFQNKNLKIVIWTNFIGTLKLICDEIQKLNINVKAIWGGVPIETDEYDDTKTREDIRKEFVDSKSGLDILVANPAACSESISLHKTCYNAIYYDLSFNCAQYVQSLDRIHRVGGSEDKTINYYYLQYERSIEQKIMNNLEIKRERMAKLIERDYTIYSLDMFEDDNTDLDIYSSILEDDNG